ncbi:hypothetical protein ILUMI_06158 [Ignelater luminosus]|uniref:Uncharacterized protein n=1 Tax=Ignelater luminosus TaxID=2038154 RepID=A0A8K0GFN4_IGNLU|nr:hypothetical protein ILUMI_06158 [Ignelater luminosus]
MAGLFVYLEEPPAVKMTVALFTRLQQIYDKYSIQKLDKKIRNFAPEVGANQENGRIKELSIQDVRLFREADIDSDHVLLVMLREQIIKKKKHPKTRIQGIRQEYTDKVNEKLKEQEDGSINERWKNIEEAVLYRAKQMRCKNLKKKREE